MKIGMEAVKTFSQTGIGVAAIVLSPLSSALFYSGGHTHGGVWYSKTFFRCSAFCIVRKMNSTEKCRNRRAAGCVALLVKAISLGQITFSALGKRQS